MNIKIVRYEDLPSDAKDGASNNGVGKKQAHYLMLDFGDGAVYFSDAMESEDARFDRGLKWVVGAMRKVYLRGVIDGRGGG